MELYFNDSVQTVYACGSGGGSGSQQREVADGADGADVVFTDTELAVGRINCKSYVVSKFGTSAFYSRQYFIQY